MTLKEVQLLLCHVILASRQTKETKSLLAVCPCPPNSGEFMLMSIERKRFVLFFQDSLIPVAEPPLELVHSEIQ